MGRRENFERKSRTGRLDPVTVVPSQNESYFVGLEAIPYHLADENQMRYLDTPPDHR